ncbi:Protein yippee-like [Acorus gramineus]|uniref:Protein yippee-like n=1 Tax=Acorus gramineus TaxID=55184 RepID=A0AAV9BQQ2_ACOGR|nr:Protein yippee-like [Acorus gramineus]
MSCDDGINDGAVNPSKAITTLSLPAVPTIVTLVVWLNGIHLMARRCVSLKVSDIHQKVDIKVEKGGIRRMIEKSFHLHWGKVYFFDSVSNVTYGTQEERAMRSGKHTVADMYCCCCGQYVGLKYVAGPSLIMFCVPPLEPDSNSQEQENKKEPDYSTKFAASALDDIVSPATSSTLSVIAL